MVIIEESLKTKRRQGDEAEGRRDSGGSLYLRIIEVPATVLVSFARAPVGAREGSCFSEGFARVPSVEGSSLKA